MKIDINNMDNSEKNRILEMHKKHGHSISEQNAVMNDRLPPEFRDNGDRVGTPGLFDDAEASKYSFKIPKTITLGKTLFKNGVAEIDRNNPEYKEAISALKQFSSQDTISIVGGASDVGTKEGYNNPKLAMLRATNFIKAAKSDGVTAQMNPTGKVGTATEKNSPQAEAEQFVKIDFTTAGGFKGVEGRDVTSVDKKLGGRGIETGGGGGGSPKFKMCLGDLTGTEYTELLKKFKSRVKSRGIQ
jgi:hypothetical protein